MPNANKMAARCRNSEEKPPTRREFEMSMERKLADSDFRGDITALLRPGIAFDIDDAYTIVHRELISGV